MLGGVCVGPGDQHALLGQVASGGPHLLTGDHPLVAVTLGSGLQTGQVGAGTRLGEQLAPGHRAVEDLRNVPVDLFGGAMHCDGRGGQHQAQPDGWSDHPSLGQAGRHGGHQVPAVAPPTGLGRHGRRGPTSLGQALPPVGHREVGVPVCVQPSIQLGPYVSGSEIAHDRSLAWAPVRRLSRQPASHGTESPLRPGNLLVGPCLIGRVRNEAPTATEEV